MKASIITLVLAALIAGGVAIGLQTKGQIDPQAAYGASGSPIDQVNYHCWAGVCNYHGSASLKTATTTPCAIQGPAATSTFSASLRLDLGSTTATTWTIATSSTAFATTSPYGTNFLLAASAQGYDIASSTVMNLTVPPNGWIVFSETGGITAADAGTGFVPTGSCRAVFTTTQA